LFYQFTIRYGPYVYVNININLFFIIIKYDCAVAAHGHCTSDIFFIFEENYNAFSGLKIEVMVADGLHELGTWTWTFVQKS
jgi:hypothetical protein